MVAKGMLAISGWTTACTLRGASLAGAVTVWFWAKADGFWLAGEVFCSMSTGIRPFCWILFHASLEGSLHEIEAKEMARTLPWKTRRPRAVGRAVGFIWLNEID